MYQINLARTIREKVGKAKFRKMSKWWIPILEKIIHQDELNEFLATDGKDKVGVPFADAALDKFLNIKLRIIGELPSNGRFTFVSNHPLGGIDGLTLCKIIGKEYPGVKVFLNSFLAELPGLEPFAIPVNVAGKSDKGIVDKVDDVFSSNNQIVMFPAQICSRKQHGEIKDLPWKKGFVQKSIEFNRDIVPIYFHGFNSKRFYRFANFAKFLSKVFKKPALIKLPMIFLPHEMIKNRGQQFTIVIGEPIKATHLRYLLDSHRGNYHKLAADIQEDVYRLRGKM